MKDRNLSFYRNKIKYGLFLYGITNGLQRIGIEIKPYYWEKEFTEDTVPPKIKDDESEYKVKSFGPKEMKIICSSGMGYGLKGKLENLKNGQLCIGLMHNDNIAAYSWVELNKLNFRDEQIEFKKNQAYLGGMHTVESYRGKNLAAYLRYQMSLWLKELNRNEIYSISDYFNYPAIKFKKKLNAKHVNLRIYINLFNKFHWNFVLKNYEKKYL